MQPAVGAQEDSRDLLGAEEGGQSGVCAVPGEYWLGRAAVKFIALGAWLCDTGGRSHVGGTQTEEMGMGMTHEDCRWPNLPR